MLNIYIALSHSDSIQDAATPFQQSDRCATVIMDSKPKKNWHFLGAND
jgi:hypothetical protein